MQPPFAAKPEAPVLIYRLGSLGDALVSVPALKLVAARYPKGPRILLTAAPEAGQVPIEAILEGSRLIDFYLTYQRGERGLSQLLALRRRIRQLGIRHMVYLTEPRGFWSVWRDALFFVLCGIRRMDGLPWGRSLAEPLTQGPNVEREGERLVRCLGGSLDLQAIADAARLHLPPNVQSDAAIRAQDLDWGMGFIALAPIAKVPAKDWGLARQQELLIHLASHYPKLGLMLIGGQGDQEILTTLAKYWPGPKAICAGAPIQQTLALLSHARLLIGTDSGPMHMAASVGMPTVIAFSGAGQPGRWAPFGTNHTLLRHPTACSPCLQRQCPVPGHPCMAQITVDQMAQAIEAHLLQPVAGILK
jgi:ADP-heptose:LPS heptosyltransferase